MIILVYGGGSSGKSAYAEDYVCQTQYKNKYYLATMSATDPESLERIKRHRKLREGKSFITLEESVDIVNAIDKIDSDSVVLLECMSNLVANEMFRDGQINSADYCTSKILKDLRALEEKTGELVIVSNNVFEDGNEYDEVTKEYLRTLGKINSQISAMAEKSVEVVVGIGVEK